MLKTSFSNFKRGERFDRPQAGETGNDFISRLLTAGGSNSKNTAEPPDLAAEKYNRFAAIYEKILGSAIPGNKRAEAQALAETHSIYTLLYAVLRTDAAGADYPFQYLCRVLENPMPARGLRQKNINPEAVAQWCEDQRTYYYASQNMELTPDQRAYYCNKLNELAEVWEKQFTDL